MYTFADVQEDVEIRMLRTVRISQCGHQYCSNVLTEVADSSSLPLCDFTKVLFQYTESGIRRKFFPGIVERLLPFVLLQEPFHSLHHMFEQAEINVV